MTKKRRDYSDILILSAILVTVVRFAGAFIASDLGYLEGWISNALSIGMGITGLGMGVLDVLGGAYIFDGWRRTMPQAGRRWPFRFKVLTVFVFAVLGVGVAILVPFTVSRVQRVALQAVLGNGLYLWGWAFLVNVAPYLLIGGIATGQTHLFAPPMQTAVDVPHKVALPAYTCGQCGAGFEKAQALSAHVRWQHKNGREIETAKMKAT
jgi:MFS family permease